jgi:hypothetical protein
MASLIGLNKNSDDSDSENVGTQDKEAFLTKKKERRRKNLFFQRHLHLLILAKKAVEEEETSSLKAKKVEKKTLLNTTIDVIKLNKVVPDNLQMD